jgi:hypothetical protein
MTKKNKKYRHLRIGSVIRKTDEWLAFDNRWHRAHASAVGSKIEVNQVYRRPVA